MIFKTIKSNISDIYRTLREFIKHIRELNRFSERLSHLMNVSRMTTNFFNYSISEYFFGTSARVEKLYNNNIIKSKRKSSFPILGIYFLIKEYNTKYGVIDKCEILKPTRDSKKTFVYQRVLRNLHTTGIRMVKTYG